MQVVVLLTLIFESPRRMESGIKEWGDTIRRQLRLWFVFAMTAPGITAANSPGTFERAFDRAVFSHRLDVIMTTGWSKTATLAKNGTQEELI